MAIPLPPGIKPQETAPDVGTYKVRLGNKKLAQNKEDVKQVMARTLTPEHLNDPNIHFFIKRYLETRDHKQSAKDIGLHPKDGLYLIGQDDIYLCIKEITEMAVEKFGFAAEDVVAKVKEIGFIDPLDFEDENTGRFKKLSEMPADVRRAIKKMKVKNIFEKDPNGFETKFKEAEIIEIEFWDKMKSLELLGREKELFKESKKVQHDITRDMSNILLESRQRADERLLIDVTPERSEDET